ncbi:hypothetical protein KI688_007947 [Linnemannia hyalina]|uniref:Uncharacterized protein n=1 Tax=Linnemannia hyalina TaxID=64524 RepID=A0A9P8BMB5_9FUNG|nr:hypothetical protein KI688_007947 [Linnemannia hyalina]
MLFTANSLVRSVAGQLSVELKKMYKNGTHLLYDQVKTLKDKGRLEAHIDIRILENISAAENYLTLNELIPNSWRLAPTTPLQQPFVTFSERELALSDDDNTALASSKAVHRGAIKLLSLDQIRDHLQLVEETKPKDYHRGGYIPQGSIRTDGFLVQAMTLKLRERQDALFKRLAEEDMPSRITTAVAGVNGFLQEIRNVIKSEQDIKELWPGKDVDRMKILTLDGGQACVVGVFAHIPNDLDGKKAEERSSMDGIITTNQESTSLASQGSASVDPVPASASTFTSAQPHVTDSPLTLSRPAYYNLATWRETTIGMDVPSMVEVYLTDSRVEFKNKDKLNFASSIRVFVEKVKARFAEAWSIHSQRKSELEMTSRASQTSSSSNRSTQRQKSSQHFNRYRTIDRPPPVDHKDTMDTIKQERPTTLVHRCRYSVKPRTRKNQARASTRADGVGSSKSISSNTDAKPKSSQPRQSRKRKAIDDTQAPTRLSKRKAVEEAKLLMLHPLYIVKIVGQ